MSSEFEEGREGSPSSTLTLLKEAYVALASRVSPEKQLVVMTGLVCLSYALDGHSELLPANAQVMLQSILDALETLLPSFVSRSSILRFYLGLGALGSLDALRRISVERLPHYRAYVRNYLLGIKSKTD